MPIHAIHASNPQDERRQVCHSHNCLHSLPFPLPFPSSLPLPPLASSLSLSLSLSLPRSLPPFPFPFLARSLPPLACSLFLSLSFPHKTFPFPFPSSACLLPLLARSLLPNLCCNDFGSVRDRARKKSLHRGFGRDMEREGASGGNEQAEEGKGKGKS